MSAEYEEIRSEETADIPLRSEALDPGFILEPLGRLMHTRVDKVDSSVSVAEAARMMAKSNSGCVVVMEGDRLIGIFSERDVLNKVVAAGLSPTEEKVVTHMTPDPECLGPDDEVAYALNKMAVGEFRRVPVLDDQGRLLGIFSITDLKRLVLDHFEKEILTLPPRPLRSGPHDRYGG